MASVMMLATLIALFSGNQVSKSMDVILEQRLPAMLQTLRLAKAVDALAATGTSLQSVSSEADRQLAVQEFTDAVTEFEQSLNDIDSTATEMEDVRRSAAALTREPAQTADYGRAADCYDAGAAIQTRTPVLQPANL